MDVETERLLFDSLLFGVWKNTTRLMVTHRLSVLDRVDRVLFLKDGRIVDQGPMAALVVRNREFREFIHSMGTEEGSAPKAVESGVSVDVEITEEPV